MEPIPNQPITSSSPLGQTPAIKQVEATTKEATPVHDIAVRAARLLTYR